MKFLFKYLRKNMVYFDTKIEIDGEFYFLKSEF
jgi:hypothetical protein